MSGRSKWSTIKRKKGANDAQRAKIFTKIAREIIVAVKAGGPDPDNNSSLKDAIAKARSNNMPNDNINRTIKKCMAKSHSVREIKLCRLKIITRRNGKRRVNTE